MDASDLFNTAVSSLYETVLDASQWRRALMDLAALFGSPRVALFDYDFKTSSPSNFRLHGYGPEFERTYGTDYWAIDHQRLIAMHEAVGEWLADELMLDVRPECDRECTSDLPVHRNVGWVAGCKILGDEESCTFLSMTRPPGAERFGEVARQTYFALRPHLQQVARMKQRVDALASRYKLACAALDRLHAAIVLTDSTRGIHLINACGSEMLGPGAPINVVRGQLICRQSRMKEHLSRLIEGACTAPPRGGALRFPQAAGASDWIVLVMPIPKDHELSALARGPLAMLVVSDPQADHMPQEIYRTLFSLTPCESSLMAALARGVSVAEWSTQRGVSEATVRTQLHSLFEKTGTDSQTRLVGLFKSLPPLS